MLESNTCSYRSLLSGDAPSRDAAERTLQKGCAAAITNSRDPTDRCDRCLRDVAVTPRAASKAAGMLPSIGDSVRPTPTSGGRASPYVGYVLIFEPTHPNAHKDGYVAEHTKVMAERLGRPLQPFEEVHHKNGIRSDNRAANLELWARGMQPPGSRVSDLIDAAVRVLKLYQPELLNTDSLDNWEKDAGDTPRLN
jgi:HNH endonuclease